MCFKKLVFIIPVFFTSICIAQQKEPESIIEELTDQLVEELGEDYDYDQIVERLLFYHQFPIDLNKTQGEELKELQFLSPLHIENLLNYRNTAGEFLSLYELQSIDGFDFLTVQRLLPFITVSEKGSLKDIDFKGIAKEGKHDLMLRYGRSLQLSEGFLRSRDSDKSRYLGNPDRYFIRYRFQLPKRFQVSVNMKKDAGEQFFYGSQKHGFDFYSASLHFFEMGRVKNLVLGDYSLQFGQGLSLWSGFGFGKGSILQNIAKQGLGVRPYTSTNEVLFLRGLAGTINLNGLELTPFLSFRKLDATINEKEDTFGAFSSSGYNRTATELTNRKSVEQLLYGVNLKYRLNTLNLGVNVYQTRFNKHLVPAPRLYNKFSFTGDQLTNSSFYYNYTFGGTYMFGEIAHSFSGGIASINGLISSISHDLSLVLLHRVYQKSYFSLYNQAFSENTDTRNENGFYSGLQWSPNRMFSWTVYADYFKFPWLKFRVDAPSHGYDMFSLFTYSPDKKTEANVRYRFRKKQENSTIENTINILSNVVRHQIRCELKYPGTENISFRTRLELSSYQKDDQKNEIGLMAYQDVLYKPMSSTFSGNIRLAFFNTDSYNSRIYAYENDVLYGYSFPAYANKGVRFYGNLRYKINRKMDVWFRYASFVYNEYGIGSGLDEISGKVKSDIRLQFRIQI
jgi:hypothetical protein